MEGEDPVTLGFPLQDNVTIWLYDALGNRSMVLTEVGEISIDHTFQGVEELSFQMPAEDPRALYLIADGLIEYPEGRFWINSNYADKNPTPLRTVKARSRWIQLSWISKPSTLFIEGKTVEEGLATILAGTGWTAGTVATRVDVYSHQDIDKTALEHIRSWAQITNTEVEFDTENKVVHLLDQVGEEKDLGFFYGSNLLEINRDFKAPEVTRLYPRGANGVTIAGVNPTGNTYIENYSWYMSTYGITEAQARARFRKDATWEDTRFLASLALYDVAVIYLEELSKPQIAYSGKVINLSKLTTVTADDLVPGDYVPVYDEKLGTQVATRITRIKSFPMEPQRDEVELELFNAGLSETTSGGSSSGAGSDWILSVDENNDAVVVSSSLLEVNALQFTAVGTANAAMAWSGTGVATNAATLTVQFRIDSDDIGPTFDIPIEAGEIAVSFANWAIAIDEGPHTLRVYCSVSAGTITWDQYGSRYWAMIYGALSGGSGGAPVFSVAEIIDEIQAADITEEFAEAVTIDLITIIDVDPDTAKTALPAVDLANTVDDVGFTSIAQFVLNHPVYSKLNGPGVLTLHDIFTLDPGHPELEFFGDTLLFNGDELTFYVEP